MHKSKFPGKSLSKHPKLEASYNDLSRGGFSAGNLPSSVSREYRESLDALVLDEVPNLKLMFGIPMFQREEEVCFKECIYYLCD